MKIIGDSDLKANPYLISEITFSETTYKDKNDCYAHFVFKDRELAQTFYKCLRITIMTLITDEYDPKKIEFLFTHSLSEIDCTVTLKGNIKQAIEILKDDGAIKGKLEFALSDDEEKELHDFLLRSEKCKYMASISRVSLADGLPCSTVKNEKRSPELESDAALSTSQVKIN